MALIDGMLQELEQEAQTTRRVLERVPDDPLSPGGRTKRRGRSASLRCMSRWCPAGSPSSSRRRLRLKRRSSYRPSPKSASELIPALDQSIAKATERARRHGRRHAHGDVATDAGRSRAVRDPARRAPAIDHAEPLVSPPRAVDGVPARAWRPVPSIYGPSADENPFA